MITTAQIQDILDRGATVVGSDGDKIGKVEQVYLDDRTGEPSWVTVKTGLFGTGESFVPLDQATLEGDTIRVPHTKDKVKDAPRIADADQSLSPEEEDELYGYYGVGGTYAGTTDTYTSGETGRHTGTDTGTTGTDTYTTGAAGTGGAAGTDASTAGTYTTGTAGTADLGDRTGRDDASVVLSEEDVNVGTRQREAGRARLRKYVVTENVTKTVPVQREEVRIEREPIHDADAARADIGNDEASVTLHEDEVVVDKDARPVERVSLGTETVTDQETVTEEVRKEQVETDVDGTTRGDTNRH